MSWKRQICSLLCFTGSWNGPKSHWHHFLFPGFPRRECYLCMCHWIWRSPMWRLPRSVTPSPVWWVQWPSDVHLPVWLPGWDIITGCSCWNLQPRVLLLDIYQLSESVQEKTTSTPSVCLGWNGGVCHRSRRLCSQPSWCRCSTLWAGGAGEM